jgi:hypothetical protein
MGAALLQIIKDFGVSWSWAIHDVSVKHHDTDFPYMNTIQKMSNNNVMRARWGEDVASGLHTLGCFCGDGRPAQT